MKFTGRWKMLSALMLLTLANCITTQKANLSVEALVGTWINGEYAEIGVSYSAKEVVTSDGVLKSYDQLTDTKQRNTYQLSIVDSWYDENGDIWFKCVWERIGAAAEVDTIDFYYSLNKLSSAGTVWECCWKASDYPTELSQLAGGYTVHFRQ